MKKNAQENGFTLVELMVAVSIFAVIMSVSMGAVFAIMNTNRKTSSMKTAMDNLNFALETISREVRFGTRYHCETLASATPPFTSPKNCTDGGSLISFLSNDGTQQIAYRLTGGVITKSSDGGVSYIPVTGSEVTIQSLTFYVFGAALDDLQPKVHIKIKGYAGGKPGVDTNFTVQTMVSERALDVAP